MNLRDEPPDPYLMFDDYGNPIDSDGELQQPNLPTIQPVSAIFASRPALDLSVHRPSFVSFEELVAPLVQIGTDSPYLVASTKGYIY